MAFGSCDLINLPGDDTEQTGPGNDDENNGDNGEEDNGNENNGNENNGEENNGGENNNGGDEGSGGEQGGQGTEASPYTVADALALIAAGKHDSDAEVYVKGIISRLESYASNYGNIRYYISDDGKTGKELYIYDGFYLDKEWFKSLDQVAVGDKVVIKGKLFLYKGTPELNRGNYIVSHIPGEGGNQGGNQGGNDDPVEQPASGWLELPATPENSGLEYYSHDFKMNGKTYRNYSFGWSQKDYVALWVAYPMCGMYVQKNVSRTDAWAYDPKLGSGKSSAPFGGYGGSYSRGHQVASSDRLCCREANEQTFYGTNMTPQLQDLNGVKWEHLESDVRAICKAVDTVYVVTGCVVKGSKERVPDSDGNQMTVPVGYFKALLSYDASSTTNKWACSAFYFEHKGYDSGTSLRTFAMSVDALEAKTGFDFFPNLKSMIGEAEADRLEAQDPKSSSFWWSYID